MTDWRCKHRFCIYCEQAHCTLEEISVDSTGRCICCLLIELPKGELHRLRRETLVRYEGYWEE